MESHPNTVIFSYDFVICVFSKKIFLSYKHEIKTQLLLGVGALTRPICGNILKEAGTISPITRMVQDSLVVHKDHGFCRKNRVLLRDQAQLRNSAHHFRASRLVGPLALSG
jgi:hypothetical protein